MPKSNVIPKIVLYSRQSVVYPQKTFHQKCLVTHLPPDDLLAKAIQKAIFSRYRYKYAYTGVKN